MNKKRQTIDGFVPRRQSGRNLAPAAKKEDFVIQKKPAIERRKIAEKPQKVQNLEDTLSVIEIEDKKPQISGARSRRRQEKSEFSPKLEKKFEKLNAKREKKGKKALSMSGFLVRRKIKRGFLIFSILLFAFLAFRFGPLVFSAISNFSRITNGGSIFDLTKTEKLKQDDAGRTNILIFGTSPEGWDGEDLADSIMVVSANQETGQAHTISLPRDLWVKHKCPYFLGTTSGKLNESYFCGKFSEGIFDKTASEEKKKKGEEMGQKELSSAVEEVLGLKIHYTVHANWQVLVQTIDAIGGIDVKVEVWDGSPYMYDVATKIRYKNGEVAHMNGQQALDFSRARGSMGGYGLSGGNFDRERNQQKVLKATIEKINKEKFNFDALMKISDSLGDNIKTNFSFSEIRAAADLASKNSAQNIKSLPLVGEDSDLLTTGEVGAASAVLPSAGLYDYSEIHKFIAKNTKTGDFISEEAKITILNGTEIAGLAGKKKQELEVDGFNIISIGDSPEKGVSNHKIFEISKKSPATIAKLKEKFGVSSQDLPSAFEKYRATSDIVIVLGENE